MAKITFQLICFNADAFLEPVLETLRQFTDLSHIVVTEGPVAYWQNQGFTQSTDNTLELLYQYLPQRQVIHGQFQEKDDMMRAAEHLIPKDTTHIWMVDADEIWQPKTLQMMQYSIDNYDSISFVPYSFYGGLDRYLTGFEEAFEWVRIQRWHEGAHWHTHRPPTVLNPNGIPYRKCRHLSSRERFYHYSYVLPNQVRSKISYYESWGAGTIPDYFNKVYLRWVNAPNGYARRALEEEYNGVHEWLPRRRSDCYTAEFKGAHPEVIQKRLPYYQTRLHQELLVAQQQLLTKLPR